MFHHRAILRKASVFTLMTLLCINFNSAEVKASSTGGGGGGGDDRARKFKEEMRMKMKKKLETSGVGTAHPKAETEERKAPAKTAPTPAPAPAQTTEQQCIRAYNSFINASAQTPHNGLHTNNHVLDHIHENVRRTGQLTSYFDPSIVGLPGLRTYLDASGCTLDMGSGRPGVSGGECQLNCTRDIGMNASTRAATTRITVRYLPDGTNPRINTMFPS